MTSTGRLKESHGPGSNINFYEAIVYKLAEVVTIKT